MIDHGINTLASLVADLDTEIQRRLDELAGLRRKRRVLVVALHVVRDGDVPPEGWETEGNGATVSQVTTAATSPRRVNRTLQAATQVDQVLGSLNPGDTVTVTQIRELGFVGDATPRATLDCRIRRVLAALVEAGKLREVRNGFHVAWEVL